MKSTLVRMSAAAAALLVIGAGTARAQDVDARWRAWTGCWTPQSRTIGLGSGTVCVVPATGTSAVEILSISGSSVVDRARIEADGQPHPVTRDGCTGTQTARWSESGTRVYVAEDMTCAGTARHSQGVMSFDQQYRWLDVRGITSGTSQGVAVARYEALLDSTGLPDEVIPAFRLRGPAANNAILAASAPLTLGDIVDVSAQTDSGIVATWVMERTKGVKLNIDAKQLTMLADRKVAPSVIDVLVALAYPANFALNPNSLEAESRPVVPSTRSVSSVRDYGVAWYDPYFAPWAYGYYSPYYYGYRSGYGYYGYYGYGGYGGYYSPWYGYYPGTQPIVVVNNPQDGNVGSGTTHGRVVKGRGYTSGSSSGSSGGGASVQSGGSSGSSGSSSSGSAGSASSGSSGSSSSGSTGRTAVRKPPL